MVKGVKAGEKVMAKWPGSALWFPAVVLSIGDDGESYEVRFEDGTEDDLSERHVQKETNFRRSRSRSPARKSPSRRRSRSPARKASPSRKKAESPSRKSSASPSRKSAASPSRKSRKRSPVRKVAPVAEKTPTRPVAEKRVTRTESHYSTRSAVQLGAQTLESPVNLKSGRVPKTRQYEFGGPVGAFLMMIGFPIFSFYLYFACNEKKCQFAYPTIISLNWRDYYDCTAYEIVLGWLVYQAVMSLLPVGRLVRGMPLRTGVRLQYRLNGFFNAVVSIALFITMIYYKCGVNVILDKFLQMNAAILFASFLLAVVLYILARRSPGHALAPKGNSGNILYDFILGHELNPRPFWNFDVKLFIINAGMVGMILLDIGYLARAWTGFPDNPPYPLLCLVFFRVFYVMDILFFQETMLTGLDMQKEGVGFYLTYAALSSSFLWSLQARYCASFPPTNMPLYCLIPTILLNVAGYIVYRQSNLMKCQFRRNPNSKDMAALESIPTSSSRRLLVAGWWGQVRKPNYLGDIMMALSFGFYCGFNSIFPYIYPIVLILFLVARERDDSKACKDKYGAAWDRYCKRVPYRFIPYIY
ncbi:delta(14)-sterol reductase TM7SF2-like isoform X3 [Amphiura filiformis]|uniref:delta(14)-sterol reductase TM7SF2-like isoform X3 n=1 Tax=Amphiura filiformis TaxID=82378 RepID=UPI003B2205EA